MTVRHHINVHRTKAGLRPVRRSISLTMSAGWMAERLQKAPFEHRAHIHADRSWLWLGEVLAEGQISSKEVVQDWMNSPPHRAILLSRKARAMGISRKGSVWVGHFGRLG